MTTIFADTPKYPGQRGDHARVTVSRLGDVLIRAVDVVAEEALTIAMSPDQVDHAETELHRHLMGAPDAREGVMAFLERREPEWSMTVGADWPDDWPAQEDLL